MRRPSCCPARDGDGAIGIKRIKERGGLTLAQDPEEAEHASMPRAAIATGMVDWVLPVAEMPPRLLAYLRPSRSCGCRRRRRRAPTPTPPLAADEESELRDVLAFLRTRTGRDFTPLQARHHPAPHRAAHAGQRHRRPAGLPRLPAHAGPARPAALLQDLLISVTNFFRDADCFAALEAHLPRAVPRQGPGRHACACGCRPAPPARRRTRSPCCWPSTRARWTRRRAIQVFATDLDEEAIRAARDGLYPLAIEADVSRGAAAPLLRAASTAATACGASCARWCCSPRTTCSRTRRSRGSTWSSCRNLLIYLNRDAQQRVLETFHFAPAAAGAAVPRARPSRSTTAARCSAVVDKKHRIFAQRPVPRAGLPLPRRPEHAGPGGRGAAAAARRPGGAGRTLARSCRAPAPAARAPTRRTGSWGELHLQADRAAGAAVGAGRRGSTTSCTCRTAPAASCKSAGGEPTRNLLRSVHPALRIELRAALYQAVAIGSSRSRSRRVPLDAGRPSTCVLDLAGGAGRRRRPDLFLVLFEHARRRAAGRRPSARPRRRAEPLARHLDREIERLKTQLRDTVEQYEASTEELKASNEELQAMNEELRSATEELETSREELQSINEELTTVNQELKSKVDELGHANSDMHNLMDATAIATVFLDRDLRITRYTPAAVSAVQPDPRRHRPAAGRPGHAARLPELGADACGCWSGWPRSSARWASPTAAGSWRGCCPTARSRTASPASCCRSSTSPSASRPRKRAAGCRRWSTPRPTPSSASRSTAPCSAGTAVRAHPRLRRGRGHRPAAVVPVAGPRIELDEFVRAAPRARRAAGDGAPAQGRRRRAPGHLGVADPRVRWPGDRRHGHRARHHRAARGAAGAARQRGAPAPGGGERARLRHLLDGPGAPRQHLEQRCRAPAGLHRVRSARPARPTSSSPTRTARAGAPEAGGADRAGRRAAPPTTGSTCARTAACSGPAAWPC